MIKGIMVGDQALTLKDSKELNESLLEKLRGIKKRNITLVVIAEENPWKLHIDQYVEGLHLKDSDGNNLFDSVITDYEPSEDLPAFLKAQTRYGWANGEYLVIADQSLIDYIKRCNAYPDSTPKEFLCPYNLNGSLEKALE